ncbi:hypothetical protein OG216_19585 [Streptomycetaceae bacterium NBC_01309]
MDEAPGQTPRIPGVKYRKVTRHRIETTVIDDIPSTRRVPYDDWEPVPPREWDELIVRGVTGVAIGTTVIAVVATTASVGGLLSKMVAAPIAYGTGVVFTATWMAALGLEWVSRVNPQRARPARIIGWVALAISMAAVATYGRTLGQPWAGAFGACIDLLAKGLWALLIWHHAVPLDPGVAHWVTEQEQTLASRSMLAARLARLNRHAAYQRAVGGTEYQAAGAILGSARTQARPQVVEQPSEQAAVPASVHAANLKPEPQQDPTEPDSGEQEAPTPPVTDITRPAIAAICRAAIEANRAVTDDELLEAVKAQGHPDRSSLPDTVRRTALRIDPDRKAS